jgi:putative ATP-binding cassette transporter
MDGQTRQWLLARFWDTALGFWRRDGAPRAWTITVAIIAIALLNVLLQYRINVWHRGMFDALDKRDGAIVVHQTLIFFPLILVSVLIGGTATWAKMTLQRLWREWLTAQVLDRWLAKGRHYQLKFIPGDHANPEGRLTEDLRMACDAPVEFAVGVFSALLSAITFIGVLWFIGGTLTLQLGGTIIDVPGFLVVAAVIYAALASGSMVSIARGFATISENKNQTEAEYRFALTRFHENGESIAILGGESEERSGLDASFHAVLEQWRLLMRQYIRTTVVSTASNGIAPIVPILLCAPKYVAGTMSLGEVMQAASAFVIVQTAFSWLVDNYPRLADWSASAGRLASMLVSLDRIERAEGDGDGVGRIARLPKADAGILLHGVSVTLDDGNVVVSEADVEIGAGEKVLFSGASGAGKSTLVRAIAGLWPWGSGEIIIRFEGLTLMPQRAYVPMGSLRRVLTYPLPAESVDDAAVRQATEDVALGSFLDRLDEDADWDNILSGGEKQRVAFARVLIQRPNVIVMDEATSALDPAGQEHVMNLLLERLPEATILSVGHRAELEAFHTRKLVLEWHPEGAHLVQADSLSWSFRRSARFLARLLSREAPSPRITRI